LRFKECDCKKFAHKLHEYKLKNRETIAEKVDKASFLNRLNDLSKLKLSALQAVEMLNN